MARTCDFLVIGAGMAGASAAYELSNHGTVIVLEMEAQPGYHTTGRSSALFTENYGSPEIRAITRSSRAFYTNPPDGFTDTPILSKRGAIFAATAEQADQVTAEYAALSAQGAPPPRLSGGALFELVPYLNRDVIVEALFEPDAMDIDVHALHWGYLRGLRARGGEVLTDHPVISIERHSSDWRVTTGSDTFDAPIVVNAAGAWADEIGALAGANRIGLVPKRRTAFTFDPPAGLNADPCPMVISIDENWYVKPDAGRFIASPADETPSPPCDAQPEELDLAIAVDRIERHTTLKVGRFHSRWAGLRSFVKDKNMVCGAAPECPGFFWLAGQGGYGIQTSSSMGRITTALVLGEDLPKDIAAHGLTKAAIAPERGALRVI
jgi:D-arginine dehydrogenase